MDTTGQSGKTSEHGGRKRISKEGRVDMGNRMLIIATPKVSDRSKKVIGILKKLNAKRSREFKMKANLDKERNGQEIAGLCRKLGCKLFVFGYKKSKKHRNRICMGRVYEDRILQ